MNFRIVQNLTVLTAVLLLLWGCATPYPVDMEAVKTGIACGQPISGSFLDKQVDSGANKLLGSLERGRVSQLTGQLEQSSQDYMRAFGYFLDDDGSPLFSVSANAKSLAAIATSDLVMDYTWKGYERIFLYVSEYFNQLALGHPENLFPLINNIVFQMAQEERKYYKEVEKAKATSEAGSIMGNGDFQQAYAEFNQEAAKLLNSFENAYAYYLAGVHYELHQDWNNARLAYQKAMALQPANQTFHADAARMESLLSGGVPPTDGMGDVVVFYEQGYIDPKSPVSLTLPIPIPVNGRIRIMFIPFSFPIYRKSLQVPRPLILCQEGSSQPIAQTEVANDMLFLAMKALSEELPAIIFRSVLRAAAATAVQYAGYESMGSDFTVFAMLYGIFGSHMQPPDLRSWLTLPRFTQVARFRLPEGTHSLVLYGTDAYAPQTATVPVAAGRTTLLHCTSVPGCVRHQSTVLSR